MVSKLELSIEEAFHEYTEFMGLCEYGAAFQRLAEIENILEKHKLGKKAFSFWMDKVHSEIKSFVFWDAVEEYVKERFESICRIVSVGNEFNEDEFLLILTMRIEVDTVFEALERVGRPCLFDFTKIDSEIYDLKRSPLNIKSYGRAVKSIDRNRLLPSITRWVE